MTGVTSGLRSLPAILCQAAGGTSQDAQDVTEAWQYCYIALSLQDKLTDNKTIDNLPSGQVLNTITALFMSASHLLMSNNKLSDIIARRFYETVLQMCSGQHHALITDQPTLNETWEIARQRSGIFFELGAWSGVRSLTEDKVLTHAAEKIGFSLGMMVQIQNDISGLWPAKNHFSDLAHRNRITLPVAYSLDVLSLKAKDQLVRLLHEAKNDPVAEDKARSIIIDGGSLVYLSVELEKYHQQIQKALSQFSVQEPVQELKTLADNLRPVANR